MNRRSIILLGIIVLAFAGSYAGKVLLSRSGTDSSEERTLLEAAHRDSQSHRRIISLAPSITEILYALGVGDDRLVGVTRYCDYPPEALALPKVGGYYDPNYEAILALSPDLIIMLTEHVEPMKHLTDLGLRGVVVNHRSLSAILNSIATIGSTCGAERRAQELVADIESRRARIASKTAGLPRPRVMVALGRNMGAEALSQVYIAGKDNFYDKLIALAGGVNAYEGEDVAYPTVSAEGMLCLNPQVIIDMVPDLEQSEQTEEEILRGWNTLASVEAVKEGRVHVFGDGYVTIPGPRFILILEDMARAIHPEIEWE